MWLFFHSGMWRKNSVFFLWGSKNQISIQDEKKAVPYRETYKSWIVTHIQISPPVVTVSFPEHQHTQDGGGLWALDTCKISIILIFRSKGGWIQYFSDWIQNLAAGLNLGPDALPTAWPWMCYIISLGFSFHICKIRIITVGLLQRLSE